MLIEIAPTSASTIRGSISNVYIAKYFRLDLTMYYRSKFQSLNINRKRLTRSINRASICALLIIFGYIVTALAHPLGNFTINHYARLELTNTQIKLHYVIDMAEISTLQELPLAVDMEKNSATSQADLDAYADRVLKQYTDNIILKVDGNRLDLQPKKRFIALIPGSGGLPTMRIEYDFLAALPSATTPRKVNFEDRNHQNRIGWHEIVVNAGTGIAVFNSTAFGNGLTDEIKAYPESMLMAPLNERSAEFSFIAGPAPQGSSPLLTRDRKPVTKTEDPFTKLISSPNLTPLSALLGLLIAMALGAFHALSPGHGKTVVGAYLIGSRGTIKHALFLGLTVTITHTAGVFLLGIVTLFAAQYVVPEKLFPIISFISGAIVLSIGFSLFYQRLRAVLSGQHPEADHQHSHDGVSHSHNHDNGHSHGHGHSHSHGHGHSHDHSHLPPGSDGSKITWRSLLALGISGGLLPCPSALVVLLAAIALQRIAYGLLLVVAFSIGLAGVLTLIGLLFVYAKNLIAKTGYGDGRIVQWMPVVSSIVISGLGLLICYQALVEGGINFAKFWK